MIQALVLALLHAASLISYYLTEYTAFALALALLTWALLNCAFMLLLRRPGVSAALSLLVIFGLIVLSQFKWGVTYMTATFLDVLVIDSDTIAFLIQIFPQLQLWILAAAVIGIPALVLIWRIDRFRVPRRVSAAGAAGCVGLLVPLSLAVPEEGWEPFQGVNHVSNFARSGVYALSQLTGPGWIEAAARVENPVPMTSDEPCRPPRRLPHIIAVLDESSFDAGAVRGIKLPAGYDRHFRSFDGAKRTLLVESSGGPTWYAEYNLLTGLAARSYGKLKYYLTRIAAERVERGLPRALARCGYKTHSLYPALGDFLSARRFQTALGVQSFIDQHGMGADVEVHPDSFFYDQTAKLIARERGDAPLFVFTYLTANHFPWTIEYEGDRTPDWKALGNTAEIDEYLRRQTASARHYRDFLQRLEREFPDDPFLIVRFGDHQPAISSKMLDPAGDPREIARRMMTYDPRYFSTYYAIDTVNFDPVDVSSALPTLEGPYLPLLTQEAAGVPLDPSFVEQKRILRRCGGKFFDCADGAEARRFNRLLMDAGLIKGL